MQISTNSYARETSLAHQTAQKQQESTTSFDMLLSLQTNANSVDKNQEIQEESPQQLHDFLNLNWDVTNTKSSFMALVGIGQAAAMESARIYGMPDKSFEILRQWLGETNPKTMEKIVENSISALENYQNVGGYLNEFGNWSPKPQHIFEVEKNQAIDILSEILQEIKA